ncbi:MAG: NnrU family protein [bacterium]|nr:NnrU family protein [bacterium]
METVTKRDGRGISLLIWSSGLIGGGALLAFLIFLAAGTPELFHLGFGNTGVLLWDGLFLCMLFFIQHSVMIRESFKGMIERSIPEYCWPAVYSIASGLALFAMIILWQTSPITIFRVPAPYGWLVYLGIPLAMAGFYWGVVALGEFDPFGLLRLRRHLDGQDVQPTAIKIRGPYRWVRHPLYLCMLVLIWSHPVWRADRLLFNLMWSCWVVIGTLLEERDLVKSFGESYRLYRKSVSMLIPTSLRPRIP